MWHQQVPVPLPPAREDDSPDTRSAYNTCLALEAKATSDEDRMHARILGYLILYAPSSSAMAEVVKAIQFYAQDETKLLQLGAYFLEWFIRPFKMLNGRTPVPSNHSSRSSVDWVKEYRGKTIKEAPKDHKQAKAQALIRDGYRCAVTGTYDRAAYDAGLADPKSVPTLYTRLAYILPESTYFDVSKAATGSSDKNEYANIVLAVMERFGYEVERVNGPKMHSLYNVITMEYNMYDAFDRLELWFESTGVPNQYLVKTDSPIPNLPHQVEFQSPDPEKLPYPSAQLLALHAACAKVAHLSGAGQCIDKFDRDADDLDTMAPDGSSGGVLDHLLSAPGMSQLVDTTA